VQKRLLNEDKGAYYVKGFDVDRFFIELARNLDCFPPDFVGQPFTHLDRLLDRVTEYGDTLKGSGQNIVEEARKRITSAIERYEKGTVTLETTEQEKSETPLAMQAQELLATGDYQSVIDKYADMDLQENAGLADAVAWAWIGLANVLGAQARSKNGKEADRLYALAAEKYATALAIKPDKHEALNNWGNMLMLQARDSTGDQAKRLLDKARELLLQAEGIQTGASAYNLACISALQDDEEACRHWLESSRDSGQLPNRRHLEEDENLINVRDFPGSRSFSIPRKQKIDQRVSFSKSWSLSVGPGYASGRSSAPG
jgi:tetratricopeptide (TPR) repeat protein